ncbi:pseudouridine synthase, partial [Acinetobacter geminorum]|uniref:pseudouridine synthase n=1 Tax=Acinetobacter geminorum TaxID=2730922 RepID=UPI003AF9D2DE
RLDRETSGILVFGLSKRGQSAIARKFQYRQTSKIYEALVAGHLEGEGTVDIPVIYDPSRPPLHSVDDYHYKPAFRLCQVIVHFQILGQPLT